MQAAIAIDTYKLPIFSKRLVAAGFHYEQFPGLSSDSLLLTVQYELSQQKKLTQVVNAANQESKKK